jgi:hypothetical protein
MWGLGATLYYAVEGRPPFDKGAAIPTLTAVTYEAPDPMARAGALEPIIERLLEKDPDRRPTAGELRTLLNEVGATARSEPAATWFWDDQPTPAPTAAPTAVVEHVPDEPYESEPAPARRSAWPWVIAAAVLLLLAGLTLPSLFDTGNGTPARETADRDPAQDPEQQEDQPDPAQEDQDEPAEPPAVESDPPTTAPTEAPPDEPTEAAVAVPEDWATYELADTGSTVDHPAEWEVVPRADNRIDLTDPVGGRYLRFEYTDTPGDDAVAAWESSSAAFGDTHDDYTEISIEPYEYRNKEAALWEYTYSSGGTQLHAYNLAIVTGGRGYALNFQTREDQWDESQEMWEQFVASFDPS